MLLVATTLIQAIIATIRFFEHQNFKNDIFSFLESWSILTNDTFFISWVSVLLGVTIFFIAPLILLLYVHTKNFMKGKTTMERFGRVGNENDRETRVMNSGIRDDIQIYRQSVTRVGSFINNNTTVEQVDVD